MHGGNLIETVDHNNSNITLSKPMGRKIPLCKL